ncbi:hypothetical protein J6590_079744 [Homalodisca vitripennis]|nr:hypothetical protein J6590_079744 [Homalodisca vitripennis]
MVASSGYKFTATIQANSTYTRRNGPEQNVRVNLLSALPYQSTAKESIHALAVTSDRHVAGRTRLIACILLSALVILPATAVTLNNTYTLEVTVLDLRGFSILESHGRDIAQSGIHTETRETHHERDGSLGYVAEISGHSPVKVWDEPG